MDQGPLVREQIDAGARFLDEFQKSYPIQAAFWLKDSEEGAWNLYVTSDQITDDNFDVAYGEVGRIAFSVRDPWLDPFQVKVIGQDHRLAKAAVELRLRYPGRSSIPLRETVFGGISIKEGYIYPSPVPVQAQ